MRTNVGFTSNDRRSQARQTGQGGVSLVSIGIYLVIATIATGVFMATKFAAAQQTRAEQTASMLQSLTTASSQYLSAEATTLAKYLKIGGPPIAIPMAASDNFSAPDSLPSVQSAGFLPTAFNDIDPFGQSHALLVRQVAPPAGVTTPSYEAMLVSYDGSTIPEPLVGQIVEQSNGSGGFIPSGSSSVIDGAYGTWQSDAANWAGNSQGIPLSAGHYMATLQFSPEANAIGNYLDRYSVPGDPELNTMHTDINMANNSLTGTKVVAFQTSGTITSTAAGVITLSPNGTYSGGTLTNANGGSVVDNGNLTVNGNGTIAGNAAVTGTATAGSVTAGSANITNNLDIGGSEQVLGSLGVGGNMLVVGNSTFAGNVAATDVTAGILQAGSGSVGNMTVTKTATVGGTVFAKQFVPTANQSVGTYCQYNGEIGYSGAAGRPVFCVSNQNVAWDGGHQVSMQGTPVTYSFDGSGYAATLDATGCEPGEQSVISTSINYDTPPPGYSPTMDLGFVCGQDQVWQPVQLPAP